MNEAERRKWEDQVINSFFKQIRISENPIDPSLHDLSGEVAKIHATSFKTRNLTIEMIGSKEVMTISVLDCDPV